MTQDQMAEIFEKCAERRGYSWEFEPDEKCLIASHEFQSSNEWLYDYLLRRTILIYDSGDMTVVVDAEMNVSERRFPAVKKLLEQLTQKTMHVHFC